MTFLILTCNFANLGHCFDGKTENVSNEYLKAARMSPGGISRWDILQLINNSFTVTFALFQRRRKMILEAEQLIMKQIEDDDELR